ncbi:class I SAM-dependent methyltransferase [Nocardia sp. CA-119907]|uniref:class I SAM-dependent methyltransferase n=1 Tax=Nocardia sp. CA-119907 TaxID=3239973 RepID=UPI003D952483
MTSSRTCHDVVVLGADFDTRAHRFASELGDTRVFEVHHAITEVTIDPAAHVTT